MAIVNQDKDRKIVPRWRHVLLTALRGELSSLKQAGRDFSAAHAALSRRRAAWDDQHTFSFAADLVATAFSVGDPTIATDAAQFILDHGPPTFALANRIAHLILHPIPTAMPQGSQPNDLEDHHVHNLLAAYRARLHNEPRNPLLWIELARLYEILAVHQKATRSIQIALSLAPHNRFVVRSAARLFIHHDDHDRAHHLLYHCPVLKSDPWLLAAEIAIAAIKGRASRHVKAARRILDSSTFSEFHVSELASALATLEFEAGGARKGRRLLRRSLQHPTENAIAQAAWTARRFGGIDLEQLPLAESPEAEAWTQFMRGNWDQALHGAREWLSDQLFSCRPAILAAYIAAVCLSDYPQSLKFTTVGLRSNPHDFLLRNNHAFALAHMGRLDEAKGTLAEIRYPDLRTGEQVIATATQGLIRFREGHPEEGRALYAAAVTRAKESKDTRRAYLAQLFWTLEEARSRTPRAKTLAAEVLENTPSYLTPDVQLLLRRLSTATDKPD